MKPVFTLIMVVCTVGAFAARPDRLFPAKANDSWGLMNKKGVFVIRPQYDAFINIELKGHYSFAKRQGEPYTSSADLVIYDSFGNHVLTCKDSITVDNNGYCTPKNNRREGIKAFVERKLFGQATVETKRSFSRYSSESSELVFEPYRIESYNSPDSMVSLSNNFKQVFFKVGNHKTMFSYAQSFGKGLFLVNKGGFYSGKYISGGTGGCDVSFGQWVYNELENGSWGVIDVKGNVIVPLVYYHKEDIALLSVKKEYSLFKPQYIVAGHSFDEKGRAFKQLNLFDLSGKLLWKGDDKDATYRAFALGKYLALSVRSKGSIAYIRVSYPSYSIDTFYHVSEGYYNNVFLAENKDGWAYYGENGLMIDSIASRGRKLSYYSSTYFKEYINDSTWLLQNMATGVNRIVPSKYFQPFAKHHFRYYKGDSSIYADIESDFTLRLKGSYRMETVQNFVYSKSQGSESKPTLCKSENSDAKAFQDLLTIEGYALWNDSFVIDSSGNKIELSRSNEIASIGGLVEKESRGRYAYASKNSLYYQGKYLRLPKGWLSSMNLTKEKNFATLYYSSGNSYYGDKGRALLWFPKSSQMVILSKNHSILETRDYGVVLAVRVKKKGGSYNGSWLYFNERGKQIGHTAKTNENYQHSSMIFLKYWLWIASKDR